MSYREAAARIGGADDRHHHQTHRRASWTGWAGLFGVGVGAVLVAQALPAGVARAVLTLPPVLLIPGYSLSSLVLGRTRQRDPATTWVLSLVLSCSVLIADALVLNALGLRLSSLSLGLAALASTGILVCVLGAAGVPLAPPAAPPVSGPVAPPVSGPVAPPVSTVADGARSSATPIRPVSGRALAVVASVSAVLVVLAVVATHLPAPASKPFTSLSLGGSWAAAASAPHVATGERVTIPVVAESHGALAGSYELTTSVDTTPVSDQIVHLSSTGTWRGVVTVVAPAGLSMHRVVIALRSTKSTDTYHDQISVYLDNDTP